MYKAVIVDDEVWTRDVIKSLGDWEGLGIAVVGEAEDGETGLALRSEERRVGKECRSRWSPYH